MPQDDIAAQWKSFDPEKRDRLLKKMTPEQKKKLRGLLEAKPTAPAKAEEPKTPGFFKTLGQDLLGVLKPSGQNPYPGMGQEEKTAAASEAAEEDKARKTAGYSTAYRVTAPVAQSLGVNVTGMEESARQGDPGGVLGHAAAVPVLIGASELGSKGLSKVGELRQRTSNQFGRKFIGAERDLKSATTKAAEGYTNDVAANKTARAETMKENLETQRAARTDIDRQKMAIGEKNKGIEAENKAQSEKVSRRGELEKQVDVQSKELGERLSKVEQSVAKEANAKFDKVREKIGNPEAPATDLVAAVRSVEENVLQGIPENIKEFRSILSHEDIPENIKGAAEQYAKTKGFDLEGPEPITWDKLQSLKSRIEARLRNSLKMNGDLKRGLYQVQDAVVGEMGKMAEAKGAGAEWADARDTWRQYKEDFHEATGPSSSGSPVAQALNAKDPKNIRQPFLRTETNVPQASGGFENRGTQILRKYPQHGGNEAAAHVEGILKSHKEAGSLPDTEKPKALKTTPEAFQLPENKPLPARPEAPTVDAQKVARDTIAKQAANWGSFNARDIGIIASGGIGELIGGIFGKSPMDRVLGAASGVALYEGGKYYASRLLNNPKVIAWLEKTPPAEIAVINKIPGVDKVKIINTLTDAAVQSGKPINLSPQARTLLGPANVARIMAATTPKPVENRKDALQRLGRAPN